MVPVRLLSVRSLACWHMEKHIKTKEWSNQKKYLVDLMCLIRQQSEMTKLRMMSPYRPTIQHDSIHCTVLIQWCRTLVCFIVRYIQCSQRISNPKVVWNGAAKTLRFQFPKVRAWEEGESSCGKIIHGVTCIMHGYITVLLYSIFNTHFGNDMLACSSLDELKTTWTYSVQLNYVNMNVAKDGQILAVTDISA